MSTATLSKPNPVTPTTTHRHGGTSEGDQRIAIRDVSWDLYERLSEAIREPDPIVKRNDTEQSVGAKFVDQSGGQSG